MKILIQNQAFLLLWSQTTSCHCLKNDVIIKASQDNNVLLDELELDDLDPQLPLLLLPLPRVLDLIKASPFRQELLELDLDEDDLDAQLPLLLLPLLLPLLEDPLPQPPFTSTKMSRSQ